MTKLTRRALLGGTALSVLPVRHEACSAQATPIPTHEVSLQGVPVSVLIQNAGMAQDRLTGATSPIAREVELHATRLENGQRVMRRVSEIAIPANSMIGLEPGAKHLMLMGLQRSLVQGQAFSLTLHFADTGDVLVDARVRRRQDAAGISVPPPVVVGSLTVMHASAPPASIGHG